MLFILPPFYFNALMSLFDFKIIVNSWFLNAMKKAGVYKSFTQAGLNKS
jgi:hypothetical protein